MNFQGDRSCRTATPERDCSPFAMFCLPLDRGVAPRWHLTRSDQPQRGESAFPVHGELSEGPIGVPRGSFRTAPHFAGRCSPKKRNSSWGWFRFPSFRSWRNLLPSAAPQLCEAQERPNHSGGEVKELPVLTEASNGWSSGKVPLHLRSLGSTATVKATTKDLTETIQLFEPWL